ncbi:TRIC cation channel family protein [Campylobacter sp. RM9344]|uniref:TRIC cation channel family protein n=1 Tax=Campylobacter californiensis TaxID=1032243 RepID=A0AAW3ZWW4_9BACT|nr:MULTISPECIES: TRIC cation channel family protein [unclassified Campylobacter]MBE2985050.1 TRIC cation channel family protein [Campylobacter sp. RM6883]MBE2986616.1 TRIC cation channel family protein [Campylobacter sp. RM12919]MBE2987590.1 TRIC cation channel family protein [Campylobacter sp. RM12920]MBE2995626.1 TRIC cation channel family protein [Campylobacter sp. RM6913]MBE3029213.1 TRIC cation channel family protein [Campylobacter sp. RM9344]
MEIISIIEYIGIASAALSGYLFGVKKGCDWLGVFLAAFLTALGGGILRDMLVSRAIYSFTHYMPMIIVILVLVVANFTNLHKKRDKLEKKFIFIFADAIDVICFSIVGAMVAVEYGHNVFGVGLMAFFNGVGGGILRDILLNEVPWFLTTGLYGTISLCVGISYYLLYLAGFTGVFFVLCLLALGITIRMFAYYNGWRLPPLKD